MKNRASQHDGWLVLLDQCQWQVIAPTDPDVAPIADEFAAGELGAQGAAIFAALQKAGWRRSPVVVGLSASLCLSATIDIPNAAMLRKPQAMRYHLEGWLPWSAEEFVADYVPVGSRTAFTVAALIGPLKSLLETQDDKTAQLPH